MCHIQQIGKRCKKRCTQGISFIYNIYDTCNFFYESIDSRIKG